MSDSDPVIGRRRGGITGLLHSAREAIRGKRSVIVPAWRVAAGETPLVPFKLMMDVYIADYIARTAIDFQADMVTGPGFYTSVDPADEEGQKIVDFINDWARKVNLDALLQVGAREVIGFGNSFWQKTANAVKVKKAGGEEVNVFGLMLIPIESMELPKREATGELKEYKQIATYGGTELAAETVLHFRWNPVGNKSEGIGILSAVCTALKIDSGRTRQPLYKAIASLHQDIIDQIETWSAPNQLYVFPDEDDEATIAWGKKLRNAPRRGARWVTNIEGATIIQGEQRRPGGWDVGAEMLMDSYIIALHTPLPKLISKTGFTEASASAALEVAERMTMSLQRFFKREVEFLLEAVAEAGGYDLSEYHITLNWGPPDSVDPEIVQVLFPSLVQAWMEGGIYTHELRTILREVLNLNMIEEQEVITSDIELVPVKGGEPEGGGEPKSDDERAMAHFGISADDWAAMSDEERAAKIAELPELGTAREGTPRFRLRIVRRR